jgi:hypothetical protein
MSVYAKPRRLAGLVAAVSAIALLTACETGPTPEEVHAMDWQQAARIDTPPAYAEYMRVHPAGSYVLNADRGAAHRRGGGV